MKIALIGYGKMGKMVEKIALEKGFICTSLDACDVCIDFSHPDAVLKNTEKCISVGKNLVIGTTGWDRDRMHVYEKIGASTIAMLHSPNFSLGMQLFMQMAEHASKLMRTFPAYEAAALEMHHKNKVDTPSGTALALHEIMEYPHLPLTSLRCGHITGNHTIIFDSPFDTITLTHNAKTREGFAEGALIAAKWLIGKKGIYTFKDVITS